MATIKLLTLNVEMNRHWENIIPFLQRELPELICFQECIDHDAKMIAEGFDYYYIHLPTTNIPYSLEDPTLVAPQGIAIFSKFPLQEIHTSYYYKPTDTIENYNNDSPETRRKTVRQGIIWVTIKKDGVNFTIGTTHFTWTKDGNPNDEQDQDLWSFNKILNAIPNLIVCGDFNVPRGQNNHTYRALTERFKDNIPADVETTIDLTNHRVRHDPIEREKLSKFVVDYIFSTPRYTVSEVRCEYGLSDHCAVIAFISCVL